MREDNAEDPLNEHQIDEDRVSVTVGLVESVAKAGMGDLGESGREVGIDREGGVQFLSWGGCEGGRCG